jgi:uncharacterized membrane protein YeaQ/YmgE (transglycosylase-associated protein family)
MSFIISLIVGGIAGLLAGLIRKGKGYGFFGNIIIGLIGGFVGNLIFGLFGITDTNFIGSIVVSTVGAVILLSVLGFVKRDA